jgi:hypothetical protein
MLVTADDSEKGAILNVKFRDVDVADKENDTAIVLETCALKDKLKAKLRRMEYSGDVNQHVYHFIRGLFGKGKMYTVDLLSYNRFVFHFDQSVSVLVGGSSIIHEPRKRLICHASHRGSKPTNNNCPRDNTVTMTHTKREFEFLNF